MAVTAMSYYQTLPLLKGFLKISKIFQARIYEGGGGGAKTLIADHINIYAQYLRISEFTIF